MKKPETPPNGSLTIEQREELLTLLEKSEVIEELNQIDKDYPYWEQFKYKTKHMGFDPKLLWRFIKIQRGRNMSNIKLNDVNGFSFKYNTTSKILKFLHEFDLYLGGVMEGGSIIPNEEKSRYLISSIMEEAIASSKLEGAVTTREMAKDMLRSNRKPKNHSERMILNNYLTIKKVLEFKNRKLSKELILEIHSTISKGTLENDINEGKFRRNNDVNVVDHVTGEIYYYPPHYQHIDELIEDLCYFANHEDESKFIHPIIKAITLHFLIGYIHPFVDGNGRTARALFYWYLVSKGYWLIEYLSISRIIIQSPSQYAKAYLYTEYDENDLTYFLDFNLKALGLALESLKLYISRKINEKTRLFKFIKNENFNERQASIISDLLTDNEKSLTISEIQTKYAVVYQTARLDLIGLVEMGYLQSKTIGKKNIFYPADNFEQKIQILSNK